MGKRHAKACLEYSADGNMIGKLGGGHHGGKQLRRAAAINL